MAPKSSAYWKAKRSNNLSKLGNKAFRAAVNPSVGNIASAAYRGVKYIRSLINSEVHFVSAISSVAVTTTPGTIHLSAIAQGDSNNTRTGNSSLFKHLSLNLNWKKHASATRSSCSYAIVMDTQQISDTTPGWTDVFESANYQARLNPNTLGRFKILRRKQFNLTTGSDNRMFKEFVRIPGHHFRYNGTASSDIQKGGIYLMYITNEATNAPDVDYSYKTSFHDN